MFLPQLISLKAIILVIKYLRGTQLGIYLLYLILIILRENMCCSLSSQNESDTLKKKEPNDHVED